MKKIGRWLLTHWPLSIFVSVWFDNKTRILFYSAFMLVAVIGTWFTYNFAINFSSIPLTILFVLIFLGSFELIDKYILTGINFIDEIKKGNKAAAILLLAIALVLHAAASLVG